MTIPLVRASNIGESFYVYHSMFDRHLFLPQGQMLTALFEPRYVHAIIGLIGFDIATRFEIDAKAFAVAPARIVAAFLCALAISAHMVSFGAPRPFVYFQY